jgi:hypothetical protein
MGNEQSVKHEPSSATGSTVDSAKPDHSAMVMRRTSSVRSTTLSSSSHQQNAGGGSSEERRKIRYLPSMDRKHGDGGLIMPTRPFGGGPRDPTGQSSPQYGWYVNITPPTPEMYYSRHYKPGLGIERDSDFSTGSSAGSAASSAADSVAAATRGPNRVFQNLKGSNKPPMGWPSVPL